MVIVETGLRSDSVKRFPNKLSYNEIFKMNSSVWRDIRSQNGSRSGIVRLREGNRVSRVSPDISLLIWLHHSRNHMGSTWKSLGLLLNLHHDI